MKLTSLQPVCKGGFWFGMPDKYKVGKWQIKFHIQSSHFNKLLAINTTEINHVINICWHIKYC